MELKTIFILGIIIGLFLIFRSFTIWYWRIDEIIDNQKKQTDVMNQILRVLLEKNIKTTAPKKDDEEFPKQPDYYE